MISHCEKAFINELKVVPVAGFEQSHLWAGGAGIESVHVNLCQ